MNNRINEIRIYTAHNGNSVIRFIRLTSLEYPQDVINKSYTIESPNQHYVYRKFRLERLIRRLLMLSNYASEIILDNFYTGDPTHSASNGIVIRIYPIRKG